MKEATKLPELPPVTKRSGHPDLHAWQQDSLP